MKNKTKLLPLAFFMMIFLFINPVGAIGFNSTLTDANNSYFNRNFIYINATVSASESANMLNFTFNLYNSSFSIVNTTNITQTNLSEGTGVGVNYTNLDSNMVYYYNVTIRNESASQNYTTTWITTLDNTIPSIDFVSPTVANNTYFPYNYIKSNVSITETNFNKVTFILANSSYGILNMSNFSALTTGFNFTGRTTDLVYYYNVTVTDKANNTNSTVQRKITLDVTQPTNVLTYPTITSYTQGNYIMFTTADNFLVDTRKWSLDAGKTNYTAFVDTDDIDTMNTAFSGLSLITITYYINDSAGNNITSTFSNIAISPNINAVVRTSGGGVSPTTTQGQPLGAKPDLVRDVQNSVSGASKLAYGSFFGLPNVLLGLIIVIIVFVVVFKPKKKTGRRRG